LLNDDQMLVIENTDQTMKTFENCASRVIEPNTTVLLVVVSNDDTPVLVTLKSQIVEMTVLMVTTSRAPSARKMDTTPRVVGSTPRISSRK
jgi:hypothetical protein